MKINEITEKTWYHGTPERAGLRGGFVQKQSNVRYVTDIQLFKQLHLEKTNAERNSPEYHQILDKLANLVSFKPIPKATFFTDSLTVAKSYADERRAFDYQSAEAGIIRAKLDLGKSLEINAGGKKFSEIPKEEIIKNIDSVTVQTYLPDIGNKNRIRADEILVLAWDKGYDSVLFKRVIDTYSGSGTVSTVAAVFDVSRIQIVN